MNERGPVRVLVVDDEPDFHELISLLLRGHPYELRSAHDGIEALEVLRRWSADLLLVDLQMPRMGGKELLREVLRHHPGALSVVVTAYGSEDVAVEVLRELGACDYLSKTTLTEERLLEVIRRAELEQRAGVVKRAGEFDLFRVAHNGTAHLVPAGDLIADPFFDRLRRFEEALLAPLAEGKRAAVVDLRFVSAIVPQALGKVLVARRKYREAGGDLWLAEPSRDVADVVESFDEGRSPAKLGLKIAPTVVAAFAGLEQHDG
jgi:CheY-like chemotaxis protein